MKNEDVQVGMKVVPHSKTVEGYSSLYESDAWEKAAKRNQPYLVVQEFDDDGYWVLGLDENTGGDFFNASDFDLYDNSWIDTKIAKLQAEIKSLRKLRKKS